MSHRRVLLIAHELSRSGAPISAFQTFRHLSANLDLRVVSNRGGELKAAFQSIGKVTVLREGILVDLGSKLARSTEAQAVLEGLQGRIRSRIYGARRSGWQPDVLYLNSAATLPVLARMPSLLKQQVPTILHVRENRVLLETYDRLAPGMLREHPIRYVADLLGRYSVISWSNSVFRPNELS